MDRKSLFDIIPKNYTITVLHLIIDLRIFRDAYNFFEMSTIGFMRSPHNPAASLTKLRCNEAMYKLVYSGRCDQKVDQWILRDVDAKTNDKKSIECGR